MAEGTRTQVVLRTQVYLNDPDYFCNKSWTMSYNMNTKSWISYHSYLPNFYIGENNFFYSGLNGCCDDNDAGGFQAIAGIIDKQPPMTSTTTTFYPSPTTTTTTTIIDCDLSGKAVLTYCELEGNAVVTVPPTTTTTICQRPSNLLTQFLFIQGYTIGVDPEVIFIASLEDACNAIPFIQYVKDTNDGTLNTFSVYATTTSEVIQIGNIVYYGDSLDCTFVPDGWYNDIALNQVYEVSGGVVVNIASCECGTTTTTTTLPPIIPECCGILISSTDSVYYADQTFVTVNPIDVPGYTTSFGIAMTANYLWSIDTTLEQWDITLNAFTATYNTSIPLPVGFTTSSGIVAIDDNTIIAIDDSVTPPNVVELEIDNPISPMVITPTIQFALQTDRVAIGNPLYIQTGELIIINQDATTYTYYISQYNYSTGVLELDINIGSVDAIALYECNCDIFVTTTNGDLYMIINVAPYALFYLGSNVGISNITSATQVATCVVSSIIENTSTTTTTTTTIAPTTTTTTTI
jgi:hypothetical protein